MTLMSVWRILETFKLANKQTCSTVRKQVSQTKKLSSRLTSKKTLLWKTKISTRFQGSTRTWTVPLVSTWPLKWTKRRGWMKRIDHVVYHLVKGKEEYSGVKILQPVTQDLLPGKNLNLILEHSEYKEKVTTDYLKVCNITSKNWKNTI